MPIISPIMSGVERCGQMLSNKKKYIVPTTVVCAAGLASPLCQTKSNLEIYEENKRKREQMVECWYDDDKISYYQRQGIAIVKH